MTGRVTVVGELWGRRRVIPGKAIPPSPRDPSFIVSVHLNYRERHSLLKVLKSEIVLSEAAQYSGNDNHSSKIRTQLVWGRVA